MQTVNMKLTKNEIDWLYQATKKEYVHYLNNHGNENHNDNTREIFELYAKIHAVKIKRLEG